jgi:hypothetical protein
VQTLGSRVRASALAAFSAACGWYGVEGWLLASSWSTKWYLLVAAVGSVIAAAAVWFLRPRKASSVIIWCIVALVYGGTVVSLVGYVLVYKLSGSTD